jgi:hypothetical protein
MRGAAGLLSKVERPLSEISWSKLWQRIMYGCAMLERCVRKAGDVFR